MKIVNPSFGLPDQAENMSEKAVIGADWSQDAIAIISNSKPNARELLEGVREYRLSVQGQRVSTGASRIDRKGRPKLQRGHCRLGGLRVVLVVEFP